RFERRHRLRRARREVRADWRLHQGRVRARRVRRRCKWRADQRRSVTRDDRAHVSRARQAEYRRAARMSWTMSRIGIQWNELRAIEPTREELLQYSAALADGYNDPANAPLMGHGSIISAREVVESYEQSIADGMRAF